MNRNRGTFWFVGACALAQTLGCSDDTTLDPSTTTDPSTTGEPSTGDSTEEVGGDADGDGDGDGDGEPQSECGNGLVEDGEDCDDGNTLDTDFCTNACTNPCALTWVTQEPDVVIGGNGGEKPELAIDGAGNLIVSNSRTNGQGELEAWIGKFGPDGESLVWEVMFPSDGESGATSLGVGPNDEIYVARGRPGSNGSDIWAARLAADTGAEVWTVEHDGASEGSNDRGTGLAVASDGVVVIGTVREVDQDSDIWVRKLDFDGNTLWTTTYTGQMADNGFSLDSGAMVVVGADDRVYATGHIYVDYQTKGAAILSYSADGVGPELELMLPPNGSSYTYFVSGIDLDDAGSLYVAVTDFSSPPNRTSWVRKYDIETGVETWSLSSEDIAVTEDSIEWMIRSVRANGSDVVVAGIWTNLDPTVGTRIETWVAHFDGDGSPLCYGGFAQDKPRGSDYGDPVYPGGLVLTPVGDVMISGMLRTGENYDRWLGQFGTP